MPSFLEISPLYSLSALRQDRSLIPNKRGIYGLFFRQSPGAAPVDGCLRREGMSLLYIGTAGTSPTSRGTLRTRLAGQHMAGNERRSTLCLTLAALLPNVAGPSIARRERGVLKFHTSTEGQSGLKAWMDVNVSACFAAHEKPAEAEPLLVSKYNTPLNIDYSSHPFAVQLKRLREDRRRSALNLEL